MNIESYKSILGDYNLNVNRALSSLYAPEESRANEEGNKISFGDIISNEIDKLNDKHVYSDNLIQGLIKGEDLDLHQVMIATEEAKLSMELAVQVRNRLIEGFNEIKNIQL